MGNPSEFANWHLLELGFYPPTEARRHRGPCLQVLVGTSSKFFLAALSFLQQAL